MRLDARTRKGLLLAPAAPVGMAALSALAYAASTDARAATFGYAIILAVIMAAPISYAVCVLLGFPAHLAMKRIGWRSVWAYVIAAALLEALFAAVVAAGAFEGPEVPPIAPAGYHALDWIAVLNFALAGPAAAVAFWRIARPDRTEAVAETPSMEQSPRV